MESAGAELQCEPGCRLISRPHDAQFAKHVPFIAPCFSYNCPTTGTLAHQTLTEWLSSLRAEQGGAKGDDIRSSGHGGDLKEQEGPTADRPLRSTVKSMLGHTERHKPQCCHVIHEGTVAV